VFFHGGLTARERVLVHLVLDLLRGVGQEYRRVRVARRHFRFRALQRREEARVQQGRLWKTEFGCHVSGHAKIRVLVDRARYQAMRLRVLEDERKRSRDGRRRLRRRKRDLCDRVAVAESEDAPCLIQRHASLYPDHVLIECRIVSHVLEIREDERLFGIETTGDDVPCVGVSQLDGVLYLYVLPDGFLVVGQLHDQGNVERILQPFAEHERYQVSQMHRLRARSSTCVQVKGLSFFVQVQDGVHVPVREEDAPPEQMMWFLARDLLESGQQFVVYL